jgi:hypothetical protein
LIVTNDDVVEGVDSVRVAFPAVKDGRLIGDRKYYLETVELITGTVIDRSPVRDLAQRTWYRGRLPAGAVYVGCHRWGVQSEHSRLFPNYRHRPLHR